MSGYFPKPIFPYLFCFSVTAAAQSEIFDGSCRLEQGVWQIQPQTRISLQEEPAAALRSGIPLHFYYDIERRTGGKRRRNRYPLQLRYNHLSQTYLLQNTDYGERHFHYLADALEALGTPDFLAFPGADGDQLRLRLQFAAEELPFPLRLGALFSANWHLDSKWWSCPQKSPD